jgi:hypothetical protein
MQNILSIKDYLNYYISKMLFCHTKNNTGGITLRINWLYLFPERQFILSK